MNLLLHPATSDQNHPKEPVSDSTPPDYAPATGRGPVDGKRVARWIWAVNARQPKKKSPQSSLSGGNQNHPKEPAPDSTLPLNDPTAGRGHGRWGKDSALDLGCQCPATENARQPKRNPLNLPCQGGIRTTRRSPRLIPHCRPATENARQPKRNPLNLPCQGGIRTTRRSPRLIPHCRFMILRRDEDTADGERIARWIWAVN